MVKTDAKSGFSCGKVMIDTYLQKRAWAHHDQMVARVYVYEEVHPDGSTRDLLGFYSLAASEISRDRIGTVITGSFPKYPLPAFYIGYFAVSTAYQRQGVGRTMLLDVIRRCVAGAHIVGAIGVFLDSLDEDSTDFYITLGFVPIARDPSRPDDPRQPMLLLMHDLMSVLPSP